MARRADFDWLSVVDLDQAVASATTEMFGDWLRDPWGWPELKFLKEQPACLVDRIKSGRSRFERITVPKSNFGTRPAVVQGPTDRLAFHGVVGAISVDLADDMRHHVYGWRLDRRSPERGRFLRNQQEWLAFVAARRESVESKQTFLATDITNFFGSVDIERVIDMIRRKAGKNKPAEMVESILRSFAELSDRSGLPQRSTASAMLANALLAPLDDVIARFADSASDRTALRWMDDVWVIGAGHDELRRLQLDLQDELRQIGLEINLGKTVIRQGQEALDFLDSVDVDTEAPSRDLAVSGAPYVSSDDDERVDELLEAFENRPETMDRTVIRYICTRRGVVRDGNRVDRVVAVANRAPHGADHLARLFARSGAWRDLQDWWISMARSPVGLQRLPWPVVQLGTMFPSTEEASEVAAELAASVEPGRGVPVEIATLAAHRLPRWLSDDATVLLRGLGENSESPLCRRAAAIALHNSGLEDRARVDRMLAEFEENRCTREMLESRGRTRVPETSDFDLAASR